MKARTRRVSGVDDLEKGKRYRVVLEGVVDEYEAKPLGYSYGRRVERVLRLSDSTTLALTSAQMHKAISIQEVLPSWLPGDVIVVRFNGPGSTPYTYVRGADGWLGERTRPTDNDVDRWIDAGTAQHVLREGKPL